MNEQQMQQIWQQDAALVQEYLEKHMKAPQGQGLDVIYQAANYSLLSGGKRLRPVLTLESCRMLGGEISQALPFAAAVEMIHTYSLIHDDLPCMDDDDTRRGRPTNHKVYGEGMAVLAGDALLTRAFETILCGEHTARLPAQTLAAAAGGLARAAGMDGMVGGQVLDLQGEGQRLDRAQLERLQEKKTGALIEAAVLMGALAADGDETARSALRRYARSLGLAFQIRDDMLDIEGDPALFGKPIGSDEDNDKSTFPTVLGLEGCRQTVRQLTQQAVDALEGWPGSEFLCRLAWSLESREK